MQVAELLTQDRLIVGIGISAVGFMWRLYVLTTRLEFILTGDKGKNGIRQQVKDLATDMGTAKADIGEIKSHMHNVANNKVKDDQEIRDFKEKTEERIHLLENPPVRPRRKNSGRRAEDKRKSA